MSAFEYFLSAQLTVWTQGAFLTLLGAALLLFVAGALVLALAGVSGLAFVVARGRVLAALTLLYFALAGVSYVRLSTAFY